jgi:GxxExxY protein
VREECLVLTESTEAEEDTEGREEGLNRISESIIGAAIEVHRWLGPGMLESMYEACLAYELGVRGHSVKRQEVLTVAYKDADVGCSFRLDLVVDGKVLVELKAVEHVLPVHRAQTLSYLRLSGLPLGLLINFCGATLKEGVHRFRSFS